MNDIELSQNKKDFIYIRDVESGLSPACVSYLINGNTETKKDIVATVLSLISKEQLIIDGEQKIVDSKNENNLINLTEDELYVYWWIVGKEKKFDEALFREIIEDSLDKYLYFKEPYSELRNLMLLFVLDALACLVFTGIINMQDILLPVLLPISIGTIIFITIIISIIRSKTSEKLGSKRKYNEKGLQEALNWNRYKRFMEDFGRMQDYELKSIILWDRYLAYAVALNINREYKDIKIKNSGSKTILNINNSIEKEVDKRLGDL